MPDLIIRRARDLRRNRTLAERRLWSLLRDRRCNGYKFRFQHPVPPYVVDFACVERRLVIEVDGGQHGVATDARRTAFLEAHGYTVIRFWNNDVLGNLEGVYEVILAALGE